MAPTIETVVIQPSPFCNINCSYCYLPHRDTKSIIEQSTIRTLFKKLFGSSWTDPQLTAIWHAGEPLVLPTAFYQTAFEAIEALRPASIQLRHSIQTNGMLITPAWCDLFRKWDVGVGVSIDGPRRLHDAHRVTRAGHGTFDRTIAGIRLLRDAKIPFHVITVLSKESLTVAKELVEFYVAEGIEDICFNVEETEGDHVSDLFVANDLRHRFHEFLDEFWRLSRQTSSIRFIREIDAALSRVFRPDHEGMVNRQVEPFGMLNVDCHGNVSSFSPELLGYRQAEYNDFIVGNIVTDSLDTMLHSPTMAALSRDIADGVNLCRSSCDYFSVCGGGAPINKLAENGTFRSDRTVFCTLTQMVPTDLILAAFNRVQQSRCPS